MIHLPEQQSKSVRNFVLVTGIVTTFMVWPALTDPINLPKMFVLTVMSAWIFGTVATAIFFSRSAKFSMGQYAIFAFSLGILIAALMTDVKFFAFFGASQRNDGAFSYLALAVLTLATMMSFDASNFGKLKLALLAVGAILSIYGLIQRFGHDPFTWVLVYGPIVGTLGNPDFMSAMVGTSAIATVWFLLGKNKVWQIVCGILLLIGEIYVVKLSGSFQGIVAFAFGTTIIVLARLWQVNRRTGLITSIVVVIGSIPILLGMVNKGPFASRLYRSSLENRMDYWHAAFNMFKSHPLMGVGLDRFGDNYGKFAPQVQVVQGQSADNAHNVYLQLAATGGVLVILPYLFLLGVIFITALKAIRRADVESTIDIVGVLAIWSSLLLISLISIDNLGVAVWTWISGGVLYAVSRQSQELPPPKAATKRNLGRSVKNPGSGNVDLIAPLVSFIFALLILVPMILTARSSATMQSLQQYSGQLSQAQLVDRMHQIAGIQRSNIPTLIALAQFSLKYSQADLALEFSKSVVEKDPKSIIGNDLVAAVYEMDKKYDQALPYRTQLLSLDPWNTMNMLLLVKDYVALKDLSGAKAMAEKIAQLRPGGPDEVAAAALIKG